MVTAFLFAAVMSRMIILAYPAEFLSNGEEIHCHSECYVKDYGTPDGLGPCCNPTKDDATNDCEYGLREWLAEMKHTVRYHRDKEGGVSHFLF